MSLPDHFKVGENFAGSSSAKLKWFLHSRMVNICLKGIDFHMSCDWCAPQASAVLLSSYEINGDETGPRPRSFPSQEVDPGCTPAAVIDSF